jgi:predicted NACHT family NTPase
LVFFKVFSVKLHLMSRIVRQLNAAPDGQEEGKPRPFSDFADYPNIVLLGDPGAGKTYLFKKAAAEEGARLIKARAFLVTPPNSLSGQSLYIDGLDEKRAGRGDRDTVDDLVEKLFAVNPPRVRISCRAADWLGESDLASFRPYFEQRGDPPVLLLESLSTEEQIAVLAGEGVNTALAAGFLVEADERSLSDFLQNPQNLIMLWRAVQTGSWPKTRKELFELSTGLMLQEFDQDRARAGAGTFSVAELRSAAGAICAARLISDVDAVSLTDQEGTAEIPGYRTLTLVDPQKTQAALGRRIFVIGPEPETVDYAHRTTAEYLAAAFLATKVRAGLPLGRVTALMGVDGHPAPELRGLHAWLAIHLPEYADRLIEADPYGILTYGDAASLSPSSCTCLVRALGQLSKANPWFRSGNWQAPSIAGLARRDMVQEFRAVLDDPNGGFGVRSIVVDALSQGQPITEMLPNLEEIVAREASPFAERAMALKALRRMGDAGDAAAVAAFQKLGKSANALRLRSLIIQAFYGQKFDASDVVAVVNGSLDAHDTIDSGMFDALADNIPVPDLPAVLDGVSAPRAGDQPGFDKATWVAGYFYSRILVRTWQSPDGFDAGRTLGWLRKRIAFKGGASERRTRGLQTAMAENPDRLGEIADHFFNTLEADEGRWLEFSHFREAIYFLFASEQLLGIVIRHLETEPDGTDKQIFLYELAFSLCYSTTDDPVTQATFEKLYALAETKRFLKVTRDRCLIHDLPNNFYKGRTSRTTPQDGRERQRREFAQQIDQIRSGAHVGWIGHIAQLYFGLYRDSDRTLSPQGRLSEWLGEENLQPALEGLRAALSRGDVPTYGEVMKLAETHHRYEWWYALAAGLNERWLLGEGFTGLSEDLMKALVAVDLTNRIYASDGSGGHVVHPWMESLLKNDPELIRDVYLAVARLRLSRDEQIVDGFNELMNGEPFEPFRKDVALELLRDFPNADPLHLNQMLNAVTATPSAHADFLSLAVQVLSGAMPVDERQRDMWLVTAYFLSPSNYEADVERRAIAHPHLVFDLRDRSGFGFRGKPRETLPLLMLEFTARLTGQTFPSTPPAGGWGDTNSWNASEHFRTVINMISAIPSEAATNALTRLEANPALVSYKPDILYALANQRQRRREAEYDRPDWPKAVAALSNGAPATVADLHALLLAQLRDLKHRIERTNTDIWKQFWNLNSHSNPTEPRPEEACRDDLVTLMRPSFLPLGITIEPEGHMAGDKRADISVAMPARKILCELKRDYHAEVWTAIEGQLERFYAHDPEAKGFGVYCVFWFGEKRKRPKPSPPNGLPVPRSAAEMEQMHRDLIPGNMRGRLAVIVIDVSGEN